MEKSPEKPNGCHLMRLRRLAAALARSPSTAGTGGLVHVCVLLAEAFDQAPPLLQMRRQAKRPGDSV